MSPESLDSRRSLPSWIKQAEQSMRLSCPKAVRSTLAEYAKGYLRRNKGAGELD
jgi:hypothetical protein